MWTPKPERWRRRDDRGLRLLVEGAAPASLSEDDAHRMERSKALHPSWPATHALLEPDPLVTWWEFWSW